MWHGGGALDGGAAWGGGGAGIGSIESSYSTVSDEMLGEGGAGLRLVGTNSGARGLRM